MKLYLKNIVEMLTKYKCQIQLNAILKNRHNLHYNLKYLCQNLKNLRRFKRKLRQKNHRIGSKTIYGLTKIRLHCNKYISWKTLTVDVGSLSCNGRKLFIALALLFKFLNDK
jgi:hypothetical protein